jgi:type I restriction enzyme, S subunit
MSDALPNGWLPTSLGQLVQPSRERALPMDYPELRYIGLSDVVPETMKLVREAGSFDARSSAMRFSKGDVLYGKMRPYLNKVWLADFDGLCSSEFLVFTARSGLYNKFLAYRLNAEISLPLLMARLVASVRA